LACNAVRWSQMVCNGVHRAQNGVQMVCVGVHRAQNGVQMVCVGVQENGVLPLRAPHQFLKLGITMKAEG
jgi:hypothetical protein